MVTLLQQVLQIYAAKALTLDSSTEKVGAIRLLPLHLWLSGLPAGIVIRQYKTRGQKGLCIPAFMVRPRHASNVVHSHTWSPRGLFKAVFLVS